MFYFLFCRAPKKIVSLSRLIGFWSLLKFFFLTCNSFRFKGLHICLGHIKDRWTFFQIFINEQLKKNFPRADYIIDLGANIGLSCVYFRLKYPCANIIAVEPDPKNFKLLCNNTRSCRVSTIQKGVWSQNTTFQVSTDDLGTCSSHLIENKKGAGVISSITIDEILKEFNFPYIDILKIDIEGSEKELFSENYKHWLQKTRCIMIELHDRFVPGCGQSFFKTLIEQWRNFDISQKGDVLILTRKI